MTTHASPSRRIVVQDIKGHLMDPEGFCLHGDCLAITAACGHVLCADDDDQPPCSLCNRCEHCCPCECPACGEAMHAWDICLMCEEDRA